MELDGSARRRAEYSSDASNYRVPPTAVVFPRSDEDVAAALTFARERGLSVTARGAGTSVAGNAVGDGLVLDFSRHMNAVLEIDPVARIARVQPGVVLATLQRHAVRHGLRFGPDPSTQTRCTLGGMIGNNACGPRAVAWGRTSENVVDLRILDGTGTERLLGAGVDGRDGIEAFTQQHLEVIRTELGRFERQGSGYALEHLLPERRPHLARAFVGSEGTCGLLLEATVRLVPVPATTALVVLGYPDLADAADDSAAVLAHDGILAVEGIDSGVIDAVRRQRGAGAVPPLPRGEAWLFVETTGADIAHAVAAGAHPIDSHVVLDTAHAATLWKIRADGAGLAGRTPAGEPAWPGWEDAAVPPDRLGAYLREFATLTRAHHVQGLLYGHIGDGCVHVRLDLPIADAPQRFRAFLHDAADLVAAHGGSLSGEHGDGRARSELLARMYSPKALDAFAGFKALFDPNNVLNPGVLVEPRPVDADLRLVGLDSRDLFARELHRCVGVGKCRADAHTGGVMCPSYRATGDEKDSTRARARVLQEVVNGTLLPHGWRSAAVEESLDLCLSCKACSSDCPAGVDMATYKSEVLHRRYRRRLRPVSHYTLGALPQWLRMAAMVPALVNRLAASPLRAFGMRVGGMDSRRTVPVLADTSFRRWHRENASGGGDVLLWADTFTDAFSPEIGTATVKLIESLGHRTQLVERRVCCGLTWISTGQLDTARAKLRATLDAVTPHVAAGGVIVGMEPSCVATLRSDLPHLLADDPRAAQVATATRTLAEFLTEHPDWTPPNLTGVRILAQPHCHQHAILGFESDMALLRKTGADVTVIAGCCGLAGNFGMERGHYDVSVAVAETALLPALRADPDALLLADGFSCRTQADQLAGRPGLHLAQLLTDAALRA